LARKKGEKLIFFSPFEERYVFFTFGSVFSIEVPRERDFLTLRFRGELRGKVIIRL